MPSFEHDRLVNRVAVISSPPDDVTEREAWLEAREQLQLLEDNAEEGELIIHAIDDSTFIHTVLVGEDKLLPLDQNDLLGWSGNAFASRASYTWGGGRNDVRIEQDYDDWSVETLKEAKHLVFGRHLQGFGSDDGHTMRFYRNTLTSPSSIGGQISVPIATLASSAKLSMQSR